MLIEMEKQKKKKKSTTTQTTTSMYSLPSPLYADILSRVPTKTVLLCKSVSKPLLDEINDPLFKKHLFSNSPICPLLIIIPSDQTIQTPLTLHLIEGETLTDINSTKIEILKASKSPIVRCSIREFKATVMSCEGLICSAPRGAYSDHVIISNPITGEYLCVELRREFKPRRCRSGQENRLLSYFIGLGFSKTHKEFKLLRVSRNVSEKTCWVELCLVGSERWRRRVKIPVRYNIEFGREVRDVIYVKGVIYWTYDSDAFICCFDFCCEKFQVLTFPDEINHLGQVGLNMGVLGSSFCVSIDYRDNVDCDDYDSGVELWIIEKNGRGWTWNNLLDFNIELYLKEKEKCLTKEEQKYEGIALGCFKAIKYLECGKILLHDMLDMFLIYDPATGISNFIRILNGSRLSRLGRRSNFGVVPHVPTLVSLRDIFKMGIVVEKYYYPRNG